MAPAPTVWNVSTRGEPGFVQFAPRSYAAYSVAEPHSSASADPFPLATGVSDAVPGSVTVTTPSARVFGMDELTRRDDAFFLKVAYLWRR